MSRITDFIDTGAENPFEEKPLVFDPAPEPPSMIGDYILDAVFTTCILALVALVVRQLCMCQKRDPNRAKKRF